MAEVLEILRGSWSEIGHLAAVVRVTVFVEEQNVPKEEEWDDMDDTSQHFVAVDHNGEAVATARLLPDGHIGRVAVLAHWRGHGLGKRLMEEAIAEADARGMPETVVASQLQAMPFYEKLGYEAYGETFDEAGIPHRNMRRRRV